MVHQENKKEESLPLLLLFLEDGTNGNQSHRGKNRIVIDNKGRHHRISAGAGNILTQWPGQVSSSWLSSFVFLFLFLLLLLILAISTHPIPTTRIVRCTNTKLNNNDDIKVYLIHHGKWHPHQLQALEEIIERYPGIPVDLVQLRNDSKHFWQIHLDSAKSKSHFSRKRRRNASKENVSNSASKELSVFHQVPGQFTNSNGSDSIPKSASNLASNLVTSNETSLVRNTTPTLNRNQLDINIGAKELIKTMNSTKAPILTKISSLNRDRNITSIHELLKKYPKKLSVHRESMEHLFTMTPLHETWQILSLELAEFAARVLKLWQYGGISFKLPEKQHPISSSEHSPDADYDEEVRLEVLIRNNLTSFRHLHEGVVNIDDVGVHMETKSPCHAFFGEVLANLRRVKANSTVAQVMAKTLRTFCLSGAVTDDFCLNFIK